MYPLSSTAQMPLDAITQSSTVSEDTACTELTSSPFNPEPTRAEFRTVTAPVVVTLSPLPMSDDPFSTLLITVMSQALAPALMSRPAPVTIPPR